MRQMNFSEAIKSVFNKYATFSGRARRSEFWRFAQLILIISFLLGFIPVIIRFYILDFIIKMLEKDLVCVMNLLEKEMEM